MKNDQLIELIGAFNNKTFSSYAALRVLSDTVVVGYMRTNPPTGEACNESSHKFYFIIDREKCVGIVFEMGTSDLHWLVAEGHRKKGHLHRALREYIFPHMFSDGRKEQLATANSEEGRDYAIRQGFEMLAEPTMKGEMRLRLDRAQVDIAKCPVGCNQPLSKDEINELKIRLRKAKALVQSVSEEILCRYGADKLSIGDLADSIENTALDLSDLNDTAGPFRLREGGSGM